MTFRRWDIVSVPFPFVEGHATRRRPALVVSTDAFHRAHRAFFGAMITTARHMRDLRPDDIAIEDLARAGLPRPCVIRLALLPPSSGAIGSAAPARWMIASETRSKPCSGAGSDPIQPTHLQHGRLLRQISPGGANFFAGCEATHKGCMGKWLYCRRCLDAKEPESHAFHASFRLHLPCVRLGFLA